MCSPSDVACSLRRLALAFDRLELDQEKLGLWMEKLQVHSADAVSEGVDRVIEGRAGQVYGSPSLPQLLEACRATRPQKHTMSPEGERPERPTGPAPSLSAIYEEVLSRNDPPDVTRTIIVRAG